MQFWCSYFTINSSPQVSSIFEFFNSDKIFLHPKKIELENSLVLDVGLRFKFFEFSCLDFGCFGLTQKIQTRIKIRIQTRKFEIQTHIQNPFFSGFQEPQIIFGYRRFSLKRNASFHTCTLRVSEVHVWKMSFLLNENLR